MFFKYFILILIFFYPCVLFPQKMYNIIISCEDNPVEFPYVQIKNSGIFKYGNKNGQLKIEAISDNDTLKVECIGYVSKEIPLKDQSDNITIELEQSSELLSEVIISLNNNEKSKWKKINRKTKRSSETTYYGLVEGCNIMSSYKIDDEIKFNGIRFFIITNAIKQDINFNKKIRPILIINSDDLDNNILPNKIIYLNKDVDLFTKIDIEFANTLHLQPGETLTIGLELIPENLENPNTNNVMGVLTTKYLLSESKTFLKKISSKKVNANSRRLNEDLYFELKVVK